MNLCVFIQMSIASLYSQPRTFLLNVMNPFTLHFIIACLFNYLFVYLFTGFFPDISIIIKPRVCPL